VSIVYKSKMSDWDSDSDDDFFAAAAPVAPVEEEEEVKPVEVPKPKPGTTIGAMLEDVKKKLQQQLIEGMFKFAEKKYGRTKTSKEDAETSKEDFALYMNSLRVKSKQADVRLKGVLKQLKEIQAKVDLAQKDFDLKTTELSAAEKEKKAADEENRCPQLPSSFLIPQRSKRAGASLGNLIMKASKKDWGAALDEFAARRKGGGGQKAPAWAKPKNRTDAMLGAGGKKGAPAEEVPAS